MSGLKVFKKHIATLKGKLTRLEKKIYETEGRLLKTRRYSDEQLTAEASRLDSFAQVLEANLRAWAATGTLDNAEQVEVALVLGGLRLRVQEFEDGVKHRRKTFWERISQPIATILVSIGAALELIPHDIVSAGLKLLTHDKD